MFTSETEYEKKTYKLLSKIENCKISSMGEATTLQKVEIKMPGYILFSVLID